MSASTLSSNNIEIKAKIPISMEKTREVAKRLAGPGRDPQILNQVDTFFNAPLCRLKLRHENGNAVLISYERPDVTGPKRSNFIKTVVPNHDEMHDLLKMSLGVKGKVVKTRELWLVEKDGLTTRIHLDTVEGLGEFIEFEVMIPNLEQVAAGEAVAKYLSDEFELKELLDGAYMDKILSQA